MKILLLGANGQLGRTFITDGRLAQLGELVAASRDGSVPGGIRGVAGDLAEQPALEALLNTERPDIIVNAAAYTAVDKAETEEDDARRVNADAPGLIGRWAAHHGALVVHFSTDYVFPGDASAPYDVDAAVGPQGVYGRSKLVGEENLRSSGARHFIFRTAWVYSVEGHNFLKTMLRLSADRDELRVVADQRGTPTTTTLIVAGTIAALERELKSPAAQAMGTWHLTASGETTWHGFAEAIFDEAVDAGLIARRPRVHAITTAEFPTPARRPAYSVLDNRSFSTTFACPLPDWRVGLRETVKALAAH